MNSFCLAYLNTSSDLKDVCWNYPVWKTCMRSIVCFDETQLNDIRQISVKQRLNLEFLIECDAYQYLLEVICGLKSDIIGETQVLGQFKSFLAECEKSHKNFYLNHYSLFQSLLQDCKELREKHIHHWGGSSYGSLTRKIIESTPNICVLGNGQLAQSLMPWLKEKHTRVFGRTPKNSSEQRLSVEGIRALVDKNQNSSLVIAAPVENDFLKNLLMLVTFRQIIDWRTELRLEPGDWPAGSSYHSFKNLASFMESEKIKKNQHVRALSEIIQKKISLWTDRKVYRPKGWDDLC